MLTRLCLGALPIGWVILEITPGIDKVVVLWVHWVPALPQRMDHAGIAQVPQIDHLA